MLPIFIPSRSRPQRSLTLERLGPLVLAEPRLVALVVPLAQRAAYTPLAQRHGVQLIASNANGIAAVRQGIGFYAAKHGFDKFIMLDDDLMFARRVDKGNSVALTPCTPTDCAMMLTYVERKLDEYAHVAISARQANNGLDYPVEVCSRALRALAFRTALFNQCTHGRVAIMEDFDVQLQLLARGWPNVVISHWAQDQRATNLAGGCSDYRTVELHNRNVKKMAALWPRVTKLREKENKTGVREGLAKRLELTIYWKKALNYYAQDLCY